ncbi:MAG: Hsp20/alpha crystallin family protein [Dehalococcoidia bacterium]|nr:MAG: Hsp20/alpha crystallin family protein [Dehalococcoidia bacterium]
MAKENKELQTLEAEKQEITTVEGTERTRARRAYVPRVDIYETEDAIIMLADMPGVDEKSVDITLEKNILTINGCVEPQQPANYSLAYAEYEVGDYERSFTLSNEIDRDNIEAAVRNGVLRLHLPKAGPAKTHKIAIKAG